MHPSPQAVAAIRQRVDDWGPTDAAIVASLNAPTVDNPAPRATVLKPFTITDIMGLLDAAALGKVYSRPAVVAFRDDAVSGDRAACGNWIALALAAGDVTPTQYAAMRAVLQATQPDPSWPPQVSWAVANLGRPVDSSDVAAARPGD